jgi:hypothetical protein
MAIQKIHKLRDKIPDTLPHAHLYLEKAKVVYRVGNLQTDSLDDLRTLGGSTTDFQVSVGSRSLFNSAQLRAHLEPQIRLYSMGQQECWAVHAKLEAIFDHRRLTIKNAIFGGPCGMRFFVSPGG